MTKEEKLKRMVEDFHAVAQRHNVVLDKYVSQGKETKYFLKLQFDDAEMNIEDVFATVTHELR